MVRHKPILSILLWLSASVGEQHWLVRQTYIYSVTFVRRRPYEKIKLFLVILECVVTECGKREKYIYKRQYIVGYSSITFLVVPQNRKCDLINVKIKSTRFFTHGKSIKTSKNSLVFLGIISLIQSI